MRKLYTLEELKSKYEPDKVISAIEENFVIHKFTLINLFSIESCPLSKYKQERQMSFLDTKVPDVAQTSPGGGSCLKIAICWPQAQPWQDLPLQQDQGQ